MAKEVKGHMAEGHMYICFWFQKLLLVVGMILFKLGWKIVFCIATEVKRSEFKLKVMGQKSNGMEISMELQLQEETLH